MSGLLKSGNNSCARFCRPKVAINTLMAVGLGYFVLVFVGTQHKHLHNQANKIHHLKKQLDESKSTHQVF